MTVKKGKKETEARIPNPSVLEYGRLELNDFTGRKIGQGTVLAPYGPGTRRAMYHSLL